MTSKKAAGKLFLLAILAEVVMLTDSLSAKIASLFSTDIIRQEIIRWPVNFIFWIGGIILIYWIYQKNEDIHFSNAEKPTNKQFAIAAGLLLLTLTMSVASWGGFKVYKELMGSIRYAGIGLGVSNFVAQYFYYFLESILITMIIAFTQEAGERIFKNTSIPIGAIALAVIWGLDHIIWHGILDGMITTVAAVIYGISFLVLRKNVKYAFWIILLMFIL